MRKVPPVEGFDPSLPVDDLAQDTSYRQILKSSSIIGGAQGINYVISLIRMKIVAVLLGPTGVGLVGLYVSAMGVIGTLSGLGIATSGVREVAEAHGTGDPVRAARTAEILRRVCWMTGVFGWLLTAAVAWHLSKWTLGSTARAGALALLGSTLLLGNISAGQLALLQGMRRIADLALANVLSALGGTLLAAGVYAWLGERGIVPVLIGTAAVSLIVSWFFARRVFTPATRLSWSETWEKSRKLFGLGFAFMWSALLTTGVALVIRSIIVRDLGLEANGIYQAAWGISGLFAGFILSAMGADFYPRLTAVAKEDRRVNRLVNEQTEIGILLGLPGLVGILAFAPFLMPIFYTAQFKAASALLPCFVLGIFGRIASWPMGFMLMAKGESGWFAATETFVTLCHLGLAVLLLRWFGLRGISLAFAILYGVYVLVMLCVARYLTGFQWSLAVWKLLAASAVLILIAFLLQNGLGAPTRLGVGAVLMAGAAIFSFRGLVLRLGTDYRLIKAACRIPGVRLICRL